MGEVPYLVMRMRKSYGDHSSECVLYTKNTTKKTKARNIHVHNVITTTKFDMYTCAY